MASPTVGLEILLRGVVQGVGLRPWAAREARARRLAGWVRNTSYGVEVRLEGGREAIDGWLGALDETPPRGALIDARELRWRSGGDAHGFAIEASRAVGSATTRVPPDLALCDLCEDDLFSPQDRRYRYPFTHCADCGPRASLVKSLPFDRARTTLAEFTPCERCLREYRDPEDRRYHAQTLACPDCGPRLTAWDPRTGVLAGDALEHAATVLLSGGIVALKGYGGFHLCADPTKPEAVALLRKRKRRPVKPFALLVPDLETAHALVRLSREDADLLAGPARPVLLAPRREGALRAIGASEGVAPSSGDLGLVLPYAPVHQLLLYAPGSRPARDRPRFAALVLTSANHSEEPTLHEDVEARVALAGLADLVIGHDRPIARASDDPVLRTSAVGPVPIRLSRATAPRVVPLPRGLCAPEPMLALGGDLKSAPAIAFGDEIVLAEHVGDLANVATFDALVDRIDSLCRLLDVTPRRVVHDAHPDSIAAQLATRWCARPIAVQHHHAHALACLAEHGETGPALAWVLDGAGYGVDGQIWGGELLWLDGGRFTRRAHLESVPLPGGDGAAREPWRMAAIWLERAFGECPPSLPWHRRQDPKRLAQVLRLARRPSATQTSSAGRFFDAAASLLDTCDVASHEAEAAGALEALAAAAPSSLRSEAPRATHADTGDTDALRCSTDPRVVRGSDLIAALARGRLEGRDARLLARRFHDGLADRLVLEAMAHARVLGLHRVALSGGCFQNRLLLEAVTRRLQALDLEPRLHRRVPPNDAGLAIGQVVAALASLESGAS